ncbi:orotate phosphoribosyltransferase [Candidatus Poribacteria bacterium]|nr:orotate phosphoribosyltransferase [Candidatus Poribacteria bacterium]
MFIEKEKARLLELIKEHALRFGTHQLSSGKKSDYYIDGKMVTLHPEGISLIACIIFNLIQGLDVDAIGGLTMGADPIAAAVAYESFKQGQPIDAFIVRKEVKKHGTQKFIEGPLRKNSRVVIVDDVVTTGNSLVTSIQRVKEEGCKVVAVIALVDRLEGAREAVESQNCQFSPIFTRDDIRSNG